MHGWPRQRRGRWSGRCSRLETAGKSGNLLVCEQCGNGLDEQVRRSVGAPFGPRQLVTAAVADERLNQFGPVWRHFYCRYFRITLAFGARLVPRGDRLAFGCSRFWRSEAGRNELRDAVSVASSGPMCPS